jgi:hypothetical protein
MEVSLQPSFTFPSRKVYANRALGLEAQIDLQQLTTIPKRATDISTETSFYNSLFTPKTLDKDVIDWPAVLPVTTPIYVQPGTAEGLTQVVHNQQFDYDIKTVTSANNALKRGNYHAAEHILGRPVTAEENANQTVTPRVRRTEAGEKVHVGNYAGNMGTKLSEGGSHQEKGNALRLSNQTFFYDLAAKLGMDVNQVTKMKLGSNYIGNMDFSAYNRSSDREVRENIVNGFYQRLRNDMVASASELQEKEKLEKEASERRASGRNYEYYAERNDLQKAKMRIDDQNGIPLNEDGSIDMEAMRQGAVKVDATMWDAEHQRYVHDLDTSGPSIGPVESVFRAPTAPSIEYLHPENKFDEDVPMDNGVPVAPPLVTAAVLDAVMENVDNGPKNRNEMKERVEMEVEATGNMLDEMQAEFQRRKKRTQPVDMDVDTAAQTVLDAPKGEKVPEPIPLDESILNYQRAIYKLQKKLERSDLTESYRKQIPQLIAGHEDEIALLRAKKEHAKLQEHMSNIRKRTEPEEDEWMDAEEFGGAVFGKQKRRKKRNNIRHPYDDRWIPDAEGIFEKGAPVSGNYMRKTGANAIPISAQLQVTNTHQFTEVPVRRYTKFPDMDTQTKQDIIPISQNTGKAPEGVIISNKGKVSFGSYKIDKSKLFGEGILSISHPNGRKVHGFPNQRLTKGTHHAISQIVSGGKVNPRKLGAEDKMFLTKLLQRSHANVPKLGADINMPPEKQLQLILGEMEAGNDSPAIKSQLKKLLPYMKRMKMITAGHIEDITKHYL